MKTSKSEKERPFKLRTLDPHISDLMGVLAGVKPVLYTDIAREDEDYIKRLCALFGLRCLKPESKGSRHFHFRSDRFMVLIGRSGKALAAAAKSWRGMSDDRAFFDWGCLLGYPECCVRRYLPWSDPKRMGEIKTGFLNRIAENTRTPGKIPFLLNNVFNFFSTPYRDGPEKDMDLYRRIVELNSQDIPLPNLNVISWHPCSYDCVESLRRAKLTYAMMGRHMPLWARMLRERLSRPVLSMGKYRFLVFNKASAAEAGRGGTEITHSGLSGPLSLLDPEPVQRIDDEKRLLVNARGVFSHDKELLIRSGRSCRPVFLDFGNAPRSGAAQGKGS